ncbi:hypothetical protein EDD18DRAFT_845689 [Armillaria luteobubalina]|uniref:Uncharacterized protein n=1 Tax=Armillaria luteobubalina TaxID=153913 RepID=A0AA39P8K9_9AGAR|nr:hypothetical protein EDD18DRAFT_845689 [Armillaria luteobubalina]
MNDLPIDYASLIGAWCSSVLYGVKLLLGSATLQFIMSTIHNAAVLRSMIEGFIWLKNPNDAILYWGNQARLVNVLKEAATITNCLVCDTVMLWRLYVIWNKSVKVSVPPAIMVLAFGVCGYITICRLSTLSLQPESIQTLYRWLQASYSLSLATQLSVTALIVVRIWRMSKRTGSWKISPTSKPYVDIIWMIVESGAISALTSTLFLAFFNTEAAISTILGDSLGQISAIAPALLLFRIGLVAEISTDAHESSLSLHPRSPLHVTVEHSVCSDQTYPRFSDPSVENKAGKYRVDQTQ